jgi:hypothetical protein
VTHESRVLFVREARVRAMEQNKVSPVVMGGSSALKDWVTDVDFDTCDNLSLADIDRRCRDNDCVLGFPLTSVDPKPTVFWQAAALAYQPP